MHRRLRPLRALQTGGSGLGRDELPDQEIEQTFYRAQQFRVRCRTVRPAIFCAVNRLGQLHLCAGIPSRLFRHSGRTEPMPNRKPEDPEGREVGCRIAMTAAL